MPCVQWVQDRVHGDLGEHCVTVADKPRQPGSSRNRQATRQSRPDEITVEIARRGDDDSEPAAADDSGPVAVALAKRVWFACRDNHQSGSPRCGQRRKLAADVVDELSVVDSQQHSAAGWYVVEDRGE